MRPLMNPMSMPNLPYQGALRLRNIEIGNSNTELLSEKTGGPNGAESTFPEDINLPQHNMNILVEDTTDKEVDALLCRGKLKDPTNYEESIRAYFVSVSKFSDSSLPYSEFIYI